MEKMNIHQRAIDTFNRFVEPDICQGGEHGGDGKIKYFEVYATKADDGSIVYDHAAFTWRSLEDAIAEDADTAIRIHVRGMAGVYILNLYDYIRNSVAIYTVANTTETIECKIESNMDVTITRSVGGDGKVKYFDMDVIEYPDGSLSCNDVHFTWSDMDAAIKNKLVTAVRMQVRYETDTFILDLADYEDSSYAVYTLTNATETIECKIDGHMNVTIVRSAGGDGKVKYFDVYGIYDDAHQITFDHQDFEWSDLEDALVGEFATALRVHLGSGGLYDPNYNILELATWNGTDRATYMLSGNGATMTCTVRPGNTSIHYDKTSSEVTYFDVYGIYDPDVQTLIYDHHDFEWSDVRKALRDDAATAVRLHLGDGSTWWDDYYVLDLASWNDVDNAEYAMIIGSTVFTCDIRPTTVGCSCHPISAGNAVQYVPQTLTEDQQRQARKNQGLYWSKESVATWDGNTTGLDDMMGMFYRVPAYESYLDPAGIIAAVTNDGQVYSGDNMVWEDASDAFGLPAGTFLVENTTSFMAIATDDFDADLGDGPKHYPKGFYAGNGSGAYIAEIKAGEISKIPDKFINFPVQVVKPGDGDDSAMIGDFDAHATGEYSVTEGKGCTASGRISHAEGSYTKATGQYSHAEGADTEAGGEKSHAEGSSSVAAGNMSHSEGISNKAIGDASHAEGGYHIVNGLYAHAEGMQNTTDAESAHAEGTNNNVASGAAHAEGGGNEIDGDSVRSHVEGNQNKIITSPYAHVEGNDNKVEMAESSHAEGYKNTLRGYYSHVEGSENTVITDYGHAEGYGTDVEGYYGHAEGLGAKVTGDMSHAEGYYTTAAGDVQHVSGKYNTPDPDSKYAVIVGNGTNTTNHNALMVGWDGEVMLPAQDDATKYCKVTVDKYGVMSVDGKPVGSATYFNVYCHIDTSTGKLVYDSADFYWNELKKVLDGKEDHVILLNVDTGSGYDPNLYVLELSSWNGSNKVTYSQTAYNESDGQVVATCTIEYTDAMHITIDRMQNRGNAVQYVPQTLTTEQQMQARKNQGLYWAVGDSATWDGDTTGLDDLLGTYYRVPAFDVFVDPAKISALVLSDGTEIRDYDMVWTDCSDDFGLPAGTTFMEDTSQFVVVLTVDCDIDLGGGPVHCLKGLYAGSEMGMYIAEVKAEEISKIPDKFINFPVRVAIPGSGEHSVMVSDFYAEASGEYSLTAGRDCEASGDYSHAEGSGTKASGESSHAEGAGAKATGEASHAEGKDTQATAIGSHAEGAFNLASGEYAHVEGRLTQATGNQAHAEGVQTFATGNSSHSEGSDTHATGTCSHAEGQDTNADGDYSHAEGLYTTAASNYQHVSGTHNLPDPDSKYLVIVGNGVLGDAHNAFMVAWDGGIVVPASDNPHKYFKLAVDSTGNLTVTEVTV